MPELKQVIDHLATSIDFIADLAFGHRAYLSLTCPPLDINRCVMKMELYVFTIAVSNTGGATISNLRTAEDKITKL